MMLSPTIGCRPDPWARSPARRYTIDSLYFDTSDLRLFWANDHELVDRGVDPLQRRHVDGQATTVLAGLVVRTAQAAGDDTAFEVVGFLGVVVGDPGDGLGDDLGVRRGQYVPGDRCGARPPHQLPGFDRQELFCRHRGTEYS